MAGDAPSPRPGQGPRDLRPRRRPADGRLGPHLHLRRRPSRRDPGQGQGPHRALRALVRPDARHRPEPPGLGHRRRAGRAARPRRCGSSGWRCCRSSASCAATSPARAGRTTSATGAVSGIELPDGPAGVRAAAGADLHAVDEGGRRATTRRSTSTRPAELVGSRELAERLRDVSIAVYEAVAAHARERGVILADTKFEFGFDADGDADAGRRGLHARLLALLARRPVRGRARPAVVRQAVRARLGGGHRLGQVAARAARSPTTSSPRRASAT